MANDATMQIKDDADEENEEEDDERTEDGSDGSLPILPPIILLDFDNGTNDDNATADEKSKRTVNNGIGYGFDRNNLHAPRKYNYYFPAGKTGTTVSIEESISPFLPRTIIERVLPVDQRPVTTDDSTKQPGSYGRNGGDRPISYQSRYRYYDSVTDTTTKTSRPVFGLRTKLTKLTPSSEPYQGFSPTARPVVETTYQSADYRNGAYASTTPQPLVFGGREPTEYVTPNPQSYTASSSTRYTYVTPSSPSYANELHSSRGYLGQGSQHTINVQGYAGPTDPSSTPNTLDAGTYNLEGIRSNPQGYVRVSSNPIESSGRPADYAENAPPPYANLPRYTVENGVRYENKVFWKYPDGRVSDVPPMTYETYSEYPSLAALQAGKSHGTPSEYESASTENSVLSQGPAQFPMAPERSAPPTPFISSGSLSRLSQQQMYRLGYQNLVGQKQIVSQQAKASNGVSPAYSITTTATTTTTTRPILPPRSSAVKTSRKNQKSRYSVSSGVRPVSRYLVSSPDAEYVDVYTTESAPRSTTPAGVFASSGKRRAFARSHRNACSQTCNGITFMFLRVFSAASQNLPKRTSASSKNLDSYSNLQYTDLLNYNPSISQYIKNPASILNVQPTFVQAGSSLIPVIILRVDGVSPIQPKATPNVNLKALLQQYLVQYAKSIAELTRSSNYDLGDEQLAKDPNAFPANPLRELTRLAQNGGQDLISDPSEAYAGRTNYEASNLDIEKHILNNKYGQRTAARPKVKSVQILEDPRFPNYKPTN